MFKRKAHNRIDLPSEELRRLYWEENLSSDEIGRRLGCDGLTVIARCATRNQLKPRGWHKLVRHVPDLVLDSWPSPELAYVIGLIASDGNLQKQNNCVILVSTDEQIIDLAKSLLRLTNPQIIVNRQGFPRKPSYMLQVCDHKFRAFLESMGLTPAKTFTLGNLGIPDSVVLDFLRGELDGDGGWYVSKGWRNSDYLMAKFPSRSQAYLVWMKEVTLRLTGIDGVLQPSRLIYNGKKAEELGSRIYYNLQLPCLSRKMKIWDDWMRNVGK